MVDTPQVVSLAAMAALDHANIPAAYLNAPGLSGSFVWFSGNFASAVTNDTAKAITVAPSSDTTGASGAWVRQYTGRVNLTWFGADGVSVANNSAAFAAFGTWQRYQTTLGIGAPWTASPGTYDYDFNLCQNCFYGIGIFDLDAPGATFQNVTTVGGFPQPFPGASAPIFSNFGWKIQQTTVGATSFTTVTAGDAANISVGQWVGLGSLDVQGGGYPPSMDEWETVLVSAVDTGTGIISCATTPIRFRHLTTYWDNTGFNPCGAARVWQLNVNYTINGIAVNPVTWDIRYKIRGATILPALHFASNGSMLASGRSLTYEDCVLPDLTPSIAGSVRVKNCTMPFGFQVDKLVTNLSVDGCEIYGFGCQVTSNAVESVSFRNSNIRSALTLGGKVCIAENCVIQNLSGWPIYGVNRMTKISGCTVAQYTTPVFQDGAQTFKLGTFTAVAASSWTTSSTTITMATSNPGGGVITVDMLVYDNTTNQPIGAVLSWVGTLLTLTAAAVNASSGSSDTLLFGPSFVNGMITMPQVSVVNMQPGMMLQLGSTNASGSGAYPGDIGAMMVTSQTSDANFVYIQTDTQLASLPSWSGNGAVYAQRRPNFIVDKGTTGCNAIREAAAATAAGFQEGQWLQKTLEGPCAAGGQWRPWGIPVEITVNVTNPCTVAGRTLTLHGPLWSATAPATTETISIAIDLTQTGKRIINQASFIGKFSTDVMTFNSVTTAALPIGWVFSGQFLTWTLNYTPNTLTSLQLPTIIISIRTDTGRYQYFIPMDTDEPPSNAVNVAFTGNLP